MMGDRGKREEGMGGGYRGPVAHANIEHIYMVDD